MMRKRFILLQALAVLIAVPQYGVGTAGENEGNHCNRIVNSVFYPYLTARIPLTGSGVGEWQVAAAGIKRARIRVRRRQIYRWCYRLPSWKVLLQIFVVILCAYGYRRARTTWFCCTEKIYHFQRSLKLVLFYTLMECSSLVIEMLLMISGDIESNPGPGLDQVDEVLIDVDDSPLGEIDLLDILEEMMSVAAKWEVIGRGLGIEPGRLEQIQLNNPGDCKKCLSDVLTCWLRRNYNVSRFGQPTWQIVVKVVARPVAGDNCALALDIAGRHSGLEKRKHKISDSPPLKANGRIIEGTTYQSYCSNIHDVYRGAPFKERDSWPPMGRVEFINLALLKSGKLTVSDDYTIKTIQRSVDDIVSKKERIDYVELFDGLKSRSKVLVEGRPGCGKTTLLNKISLDWATEKILKDIELLLLVPLRRFHSKEVELDDMLQLYDTGHLCHSVGTQISLSGGEGVCIVLDGLDEYPRCSKPGNFVLELFKGSKLPKSVVIASSRPAAAHHLRPHATKRVEVLGFLHQEIQQYVQEHYEQDSDKLKALNIYLEHHPNIRHMCYLPLHLAMVVYLNDVLESGSLPHTETGVYNKFMLYTLLRDMQRGSQSSVERLSDVKHLNPEKLGVFRNICSLAFSATVQSKQIFSRKDVQEVFGSSKFSLESLGLLTEDKLFCEYGLEETYSFAHLTFQEFLAAYYLTELPAVEQIETVREHVCEKQMGVVWKFYCGLTKLTGNVAMDVFQVLLQQDEDEFNPVLNEYNELDLLLLIHSIHESQNQTACCELLSSRNGVLCISDEVLTPADMLAVAYCVRNASTSLTELSFKSCRLDREGLQVLTSECSYPLMNIKCLSLKGTLIRKEVVSSFFTFLRRFPNLESLRFPRFLRSQPPFAGDLAVAFSSLKALKSLIAGRVVIRSGGGILQLLKTIPTLQKIRWCGGSLDLEVPKEFDKEELIRLFTGGETLLSVRTSATYDLDLLESTLHGADIHVLAELFQLCPRVQKINLQSCSIGDSDAIALADCLRSCVNLQELKLSDNHISKKGYVALSRGLQECRELQKLDLHCFSIDDSGAVALAESLKSCIKLQELKLSDNDISEEGYAALSRGLNECRELQILDVDSVVIRSGGGILQLLKAIPMLQTIRCWGSSLNLEVLKEFDKGALVRLFNGEEITSVQTSATYALDLLKSRVHVTDIHVLAELFQLCPGVQKINLQSCSIGDSGVVALAKSLKSCIKLQELNLQSCSIGDSGAVALAKSLKPCIKLQELKLSGNHIGDEGCDALSRGLKECRELQKLDVDSFVIRSGGGILQLLKGIPTLQTIRCCGSSLDLEVLKEFDKGALVRVLKQEERTALLSVQTTATYALDLLKYWVRVVDIYVLAELFQLCPRVQKINLQSCSIGDSGAVVLAESLKTCIKLQELNLQSCSIGESGAVALAKSLKSCIKLQELNVDSIVIRSGGGILQLLKAIPTLQTIRCCGSSIGLEVSKQFDKGVPVRVFHIEEIREVFSMEASAIYGLSLSWSRVHVTDIHVLAELFQLCPGVQKINLYCCSFGDSDGAITLAESLRSCISLQKLNLLGCSIGDSGAIALAESLRSCISLQELNLAGNCSIGDSGVIALAESLRSRISLQELNLSGSKFGDEGCAALSRGLKECRELKALDLQRCSIGGSGAVALVDCLRSCIKLQELNLSGNHIGDEGCAALSRGLQECRELQKLDLQRCSIGDSGAVALVDCLRSCIKLQELKLSLNKIGDEGCTTLSRGLKECRELKGLFLGNCSIGDSGVIALAESLRSCISLQELNLEGCSIGDSGAIALAERLRSCTSLQKLNLRDNSLTDASINSISEVITTVKSLKELSLRDNKFTEGGRAQLRQAAEDRKHYPDFDEFKLNFS